MFLGIINKGFKNKLVMLISIKVTKDKREFIGIRYLNMRIAKNNLAYHFLKITFSLLGSSRYETLSVLDLSAILNCFSRKKYFEAIGDDQLLFNPIKKNHIAKLEHLLKALL